MCRILCPLCERRLCKLTADSMRREMRVVAELKCPHCKKIVKVVVPVGGSTLIWFGLTWSLELYQQMNARLWRQEQKETVAIHHLIAKSTLDERVMEALEKKDCGQSALVDAVKARIGGIWDGYG